MGRRKHKNNSKRHMTPQVQPHDKFFPRDILENSQTTGTIYLKLTPPIRIDNTTPYTFADACNSIAAIDKDFPIINHDGKYIVLDNDCLAEYDDEIYMVWHQCLFTPSIFMRYLRQTGWIVSVLYWNYPLEKRLEEDATFNESWAKKNPGGMDPKDYDNEFKAIIANTGIDPRDFNFSNEDFDKEKYGAAWETWYGGD